jgi:hypothetical protein
MDLAPFLDDLERRLDPDIEEELLADWRGFLAGRHRDGLFTPRRRRTAPPGLAWPPVRVNEALEDFDRMALQQLLSCSGALADGWGGILCVRCNYGTGILPTVFGAELFVMDDATNTLPTSRPMPRGADAIRRLAERGVPDLRAGLGGRVFDMARHFQRLFEPYPKIAKHVWIYHPDIQGPMDVCELLWGSDLFTAAYEDPDLLHALLRRVTAAYAAFMDEWERVVPPRRADESAHWSMLIAGRLMIRDDSAMNFSPEMFDAFIRPYDQALLDRFGGGAVHFCGRGDHFVPSLATLRGLRGINLSQPHLNDMERIFCHTVDRGIPLLGLQRQAAEAARAAGRDLRGRVHVI